MATDGGQIRTKNKVYGEQNHSMTCTTSGTLTPLNYVISNGNKTLTILPTNKKGILIVDSSGKAFFHPVPDGEAGYNKLLATDAYGNLTWVDK